MTEPAALHPDQHPGRWDRHVGSYETVFEPLTNQFVDRALRLIGLTSGQSLLDCAAGSGGGALMAARRGLAVTAIDASPAMAARIAVRADASGLTVRAACMDAQALALPKGCFDGALSAFGLILCPDPASALRELARVAVAGAPVAVVTWSEPERFELAARLMRAAGEVRGVAGPPPQLRFAERSAFERLFASAGLQLARIERVEARLPAPSAPWLAERLAFAPGVADMLDGFGRDRDAVVQRFVADLRRDRGDGPVELAAVGAIGLATVPATGSRPRAAPDRQSMSRPE